MHRHWRALVLMATLVAVLATCGGPGPTALPTAGGAGAEPLVLTGDGGGFRAELTIEDPANLVVGAEPGVPAAMFQSIDGIAIDQPGGDPAVLAAAWLASPCERWPVLRLERVEGQVNLLLDHGPVAAAACDAMGIPLGVTLRLGEPIRADAVVVRETRYAPATP